MASHDKEPPRKKRRTGRIRRPSQRLIDSEEINNSNSSDNIQTLNVQSDTTCSSNDQSSTTDQDITQNENLMRQFQSVINNAIQVITQTVITVLQQNGCIPKTINTAASTTCTEVTNGQDSSVHLPRSQTESASVGSNSGTSVGTNSGNNGNFISRAPANSQLNPNRNTSNNVDQNNSSNSISAYDSNFDRSAQENSNINSTNARPMNMCSGNNLNLAMATNNFANVNVDNLLQTGTYNNLQTTCSNDTSKKVGLARPLSLGVDSKIKAQIWANEYIEFETLLKLENQKTKFVPEEREDQIIFTKQKIGTFKIDNITQ